MYKTLLKLDELSRFILKIWYIFVLVFCSSWFCLSNVYAVESGAQDDPILIDDCYELQNINNDLGAYYKLTKNIDCSVVPSFTPIAEYQENKFTGTLDGNNHEIRNLTINRPTKPSGLFGYVSGTIKDLRLENVNITGGGLNTVLVERPSGLIKNVSASGKLTGNIVPNVFNASGMIGWNTGTIENVRSYLSIEAPANIGGVLVHSKGPVRNSHSYATIKHIGTISDGYIYGGFAASNSSIIENSSSRSTLTGIGTSSGGFIGLNYAKIKNSYSNSSNTANGSKAGGFVGANQGGVIEYSYSEGTLSNGSTTLCTGGFVGANMTDMAMDIDPTIGGTIRNSYSTTIITASGNRVGSFAGCNSNTRGINPIIENSYATGQVTASGAAKGGFVGYVSGSQTITNSFWDKDTTGLATSVGGTGKTSAEMKSAPTYTGVSWDFTNLWGISTSLNNGYPNFTIAPAPPSSPTNFRAVSKTDESIDLAWDSDSNITNYQIWKDGVLIRQEPLTSFKVENLAANTTYQLKIIAQNVKGDSAPTVINVKTRLSKPTNILTEQQDSKILVSWDSYSAPSILGYNLYVNDIKVNENPIAKTDKEYLVANLINYETYKFTLTAIDSTNEESVLSDSAFEKPIDLTPPEQVKSVTKENSDHTIRLSWDNPITDFYTVLIYRGNELIAETSDSTFLDSELPPSTTYEYKLITKDSNGNLSDPYKINVHTKPVAPTGFTTEKGDTKILVSWNPYNGFNIGFNVYVDNKRVNNTPLSNTYFSYLVSGLKNYQTYKFSIAAVDDTNEESAMSEYIIDHSIDLTLPEKIKDVSYKHTSGSVQVSWKNPKTDFHSVLIYRDNKLITETSDNIILDSNLTSSTTYEYKLITKDPNGNLSKPYTIRVHTKPTTPKGVTTKKSDSKILVKWNPSSGKSIISYNIYVDNIRVNTTPISSSSYLVSGLKNYQSYKFSVKAIDATKEESAMSEYIMDNPVDLTPPEKVTGVTYEVTDNSVRFSWDNPLTDVYTVLIYRGGKLIKETADNVYIDSKLSPSTKFTYSFVAKDSNGNLSEPYDFTIQTKPKTPKNIQGKSTSKGIDLTWDPNREINIRGYNIYINSKKWNLKPVQKPHQTIPVDAASDGFIFVIQVTSVDKENAESEKSSYKIMIFSPIVEQVTPLEPIKAKEETPETDTPRKPTDASKMGMKPTERATEKEPGISKEKTETPINDENNTTLLDEQNLWLLVRFILIFLFFFSVLF